MRTWIKLASLALVAGLAGGVRAQDRPRSDDKPRNDNPPRAQDDRTRDQDRTRTEDRTRDQDRTRTTEERTRTTEERSRTTETRTDADRDGDKTLTDSHFIDHAYTMGQNEVILAKLALQRSQNEEVRKFAQKMIEDHGKCGSNLILLVSELRIAIPDKPLPEQMETLNRLHEPGLQDFDRVYIETAVKDHEKAVRLFERASKELKNDRIKTYAEKELTTVREHEKLAKETQSKVGGSGHTESGTTRTESGTRTRTETDTHRTETQSGTRTESGTRTRGDDSGKGLTDNEFVMKASASGKAEVAIGKIGEEKAKNADLKKFADRVVKDHTKANEELTAAAKDAGISVSEKPADQDEHVKHFRDASTEKNFDKDFVDHMVQSHEKGVDLFTKASKELKNEKLRSFAEKTLPTLKEHLQIAKDLQAKVGRE